MNGEVFDILNYCILNGKFYIHKQKLFHENALDVYDYLCELKYKLQIERMICNGTNNDEQFNKFLFIYNAVFKSLVIHNMSVIVQYLVSG